MAVNNEVLALILGGGQGTRLFPLTQHRSKPAVPIGGKYRLIDIPISNCLHADIRRIFVLTQFNSASLNRHIAQTYRMDLFSHGFVEILAAEQTPDNPNWFQGTADAVRQAARHFVRYDADYYLILAGDHLYRMDYTRAGRRAHRSPRRHHHRRAAGDDRRRVGDGHLPVRSRRADRRVRGKADARAARRKSARAFRPARRSPAHTRRQAVHRVDGHLRVLARRAARHARADGAQGLRPRDHSRGARPLPRQRVPVPRLLGRRRHGRVVLRREHHADARRRAVQVLRSAPADLHAPALPARLAPQRLHRRATRSSPRAATSSAATIEESVVGIRTNVQSGATIRRSVLLGADYYEADDDAPARGDSPRLGIGRDVVLDRVIVDKNARIGDGARLVNEAGVRARRRRRLLHPQRRHHRAEGRRHRTWHNRVGTGAWGLGRLSVPSRVPAAQPLSPSP